MADPYTQFRFKVKVGDFEGGFSEVTVAETTIDPIDYREGNEAPRFRKISGLTKYGNITLKRGTLDTLEFYNWIKGVYDTGSEGKDSRKSITITMELPANREIVISSQPEANYFPDSKSIDSH